MTSVTVQLAKSHMRIDGTDDDEIIGLYIDAAESWLGNYIGKNLSDLAPLTADLKLAVLSLTSFFYENREAASPGTVMQIVPYGVTALADPHREKWFGDDAF